MSPQLVSILVLLAIFLIATVLPVHMGALAIVAAFVVGYFIFGGEEVADTIYSFFPGELFVVLVGVTYLFAIAKNNGTVDWLVSKAVSASGGRLAAIPWVMFAVTAAITAIGAVVPAAVAIIAPIGMQFARRYNISPLLMGLMIINGATAGGFSPLSVFGVITNTVVRESELPGSPGFLWGASIVVNVLLSVVVFFLFGGRRLLGSHQAVSMGDLGDSDAASTATGSTGPAVVGSGDGGSAGHHGHSHGRADARASTKAVQTTAVADDHHEGAVTTLDKDRSLTLAGLLLLVVAALGFDLDIGLVSITVAVLLSLLAPAGAKGAVGQIAWPTVLLICGIVTYVGLLQELETETYLGDAVAALGLPMLAALLICYIGAIVSAFASTTGILGALIPLAVPFLQTGEIGAIGLITALALSSSIVDSSPFSTSGALVVANSREDEREHVFRTLMRWGFSMVALIPPLTWLIFVVPGWL
ncbi:MAG: SLC13 family permease [Actinomycetota bacterium]|nr:SLC13 family permease [Actinomycetota bacterium]